MSMLEVPNELLPRLQPSGSSTNQLRGKEEDEKIWTKILSEVSAKASNNVQASVIILGDPKCGASSLLAKLEKSETPPKSSALEYHTITVQADFRDGSYAYQLGTAGGLGPADSMTLPVWLLDGDETFAPLLSHALPSQSPARAVVLLTAAIDSTGLIHSLRRWANVLTAQVNAKYDKATVSEAKQAQERFWQEYVEPVESSIASSVIGGLEDTGLLPLEHGVLAENTGCSIIVVITKSDLSPEMSAMQSDRLLVQVRRFCLAHGAALFYVSAKKGHNMQQLYKYVAARAYGLAFTASAQIIEREQLFVPAGWDSEKKIDIIKEGVSDIDVPLEPTREKVPPKEQLIEAEDEQAFLQRLSQQESSAQPMPKKPLMEEGGGDSNSPLASFFSNLLKEKPNSGRPSSAATAAAAPVDPQAQLDRIRSSAKIAATAGDQGGALSDLHSSSSDA